MPFSFNKWYLKWSTIVPTPFFSNGGEVNFNNLPRRGGSEKLKKGGGSMVQGQVFLKTGVGEGAYIFPI